MTKEEIIEIIKLYSVSRHFGEYREITNEDCECIADELLELVEQEKKEEINKVLKNPPEVIHIDLAKQFVEQYKFELEYAKKEAVKEFAKDLIRQANFWGENDNMWFNYETLKKVAKEYGVEL